MSRFSKKVDINTAIFEKDVNEDLKKKRVSYFNESVGHSLKELGDYCYYYYYRN